MKPKNFALFRTVATSIYSVLATVYFMKGYTFFGTALAIAAALSIDAVYSKWPEE